MSEKTSIQNIFEKRSAELESLYQVSLKRSNLLANLRLLVVLTGLGGCSFLYYSVGFSTALPAFGISLAFFIGLVIFHTRIDIRKKKTALLKSINDKNLDRLNGTWNRFSNEGQEYLDPTHLYASDLDIFGKNSLFQLLNSTTTFYGERLFADRLRSPIQDIPLLIKRQESIRELGRKAFWCQELEAEGLLASSQRKDPEALIYWAKGFHPIFQNHPLITWVIRIFPILSFLLIPVLVAIEAPILVIYIWVGIQVSVVGFSYIYLTQFLEPLAGYQTDLNAFGKMLKCIEKEHFSSAHLIELQKSILTAQTSASGQIKKLNRLVQWTEAKYSPLFHFVLNLILFWDFQCFLSLENWKRTSGTHIKTWLETLSIFEELCSFSILACNEPTWTFPQYLMEKTPQGAFTQLGHPLIHEKERVHNNLVIGKGSSILLITGSNMSGKSTFLRTIGLNLVLAYAGAPVCAKLFSCSTMNIVSSMRTSDNLENHISSFYSEVLRIKQILAEAASGDKAILFIIDEIFKGTNSQDRQAGAQAIIKKLNQPNCIGLVSTHDLELTSLASNSTMRMANYHFQESYGEDNRIHFDYLLKEGPSVSTNGLYLLKMVGIV